MRLRKVPSTPATGSASRNCAKYLCLDMNVNSLTLVSAMIMSLRERPEPSSRASSFSETPGAKSHVRLKAGRLV